MREPKDKNVSYLLWLACLVGVSGLQRIYLGRYISGAFYLITLGWLGIGQLLDLVLIPGMVDEENLKYMAMRGGMGYNPSLYGQNPVALVNSNAGANNVLMKPESMEVAILRICRDRGEATLSDCVIDTGAEIKEVKAVIRNLVKEDLLQIHNRDSDGSVVYRAV
jgi:TM2 domain-containing membrane protein YozV